MSSPSERRRTSMAAPPPEALTLPSDLVLEIVARTDAATLVRCADCCKHLRRDILSPAFIRRVCHGAGAAAIVPPRLLGFLPSHDTFRAPTSRGIPPPVSFSLAHPATPAAAHFSEMHLAPLLSRVRGGDPQAFFYNPLTSRNGVVALQSRDINTNQKLGICVYDPMAGDCTVVPDPPDMRVPNSLPYYQRYVLLTASDGIGCSFLLMMVDFTEVSKTERSRCSIYVQTMSSDVVAGGGKWSKATKVACNRSGGYHLHPFCSAVVLGGSIHWVMYGGFGRNMMHILTYNFGAATAGRIDIPMDRLPKIYREHSIDVLLASTPDGRMTLMFNEGLKIVAWVMSADAGWAPHAVIDVETPLRSLVPKLAQQQSWPKLYIVFERSWERMRGHDILGSFVIDTETKGMRRVHREIRWTAIPFEVDLESRLSSMKTF